MFAIDSSGSMRNTDGTGITRRQAAIDAAKYFLDQLDLSRDYVGVVSWDNNVDFSFGMSQDKVSIEANLDRIDQSGSTNLNVGVSASNVLINDALGLLNSSGRTSDKIILFVNDGSGSYSDCGTGGPVDDAAANGYRIYSVLVGTSTSPTDLIDMATCTGGEFVPSPLPTDLQAALNNILNTVSSSTVPYNVGAVLELSPNFTVNPATISPTPQSTSPFLEFADLDGGLGLPDGDSVVISFCGTVSGAGRTPIVVGRTVPFTDVNGVDQTPVDVMEAATFIPTPGAGGDPHFVLWKHQKRSSFHGECDMVLFHTDNFEGDKNVDVHIRTTIKNFYSYIEDVAVRVGDDVLEFNGPKVSFNQMPFPITKDNSIEFGNEYSVSLVELKKASYFVINLNDKMTIHVRHGKFMSVAIDGQDVALTGSLGMMGGYERGDMLARDGSTVLTDFDNFGFEWQVNPAMDDPILFATAREPQLPHEKCRLPTKEALASRTRRRLRGRTDEGLYQSALQACQENHLSDIDSCIDDVILTGDLDMALAW